jgi:Holliday junction resolvase RusA-like endonuclease
MIMNLDFFVPGIPVPKGSAKAFVVKGRAIVTQTNRDRQKPWASDISYTAQKEMNGDLPTTEAVSISMTFVMPRPKSHLRANGDVKGSAPKYPISKPDADKLVRLVLDALTDVVWKDDSQVTELYTEKVYADNCQAGVNIRVGGM